jgi:aspartyl protease family protein
MYLNMKMSDTARINRYESRLRANWCRALLLLCLIFASSTVHADKQVDLLALFKDKAIVHIDGVRRLLAVGEASPEGVTLITTHSDHAVVEFDDRRETLTLGMATVFPETGNSAVGEIESVSLWADPRGFFYADGTINGYPVRFLVDTGATTIAVSSDLARRIGIELSDGQPWIASTAGGMARMVRVKLDSVSVGDITLRDVNAGVVLGSYPTTPLLGMSFLGEVDMVRRGERMELKKRY